MTDKEIVALYHARDEDAILQTKTKYGRFLLKIAYNILNNDQDSEESVSDTYLAAWNSMPPHRPEVLSAYLGKLARRISIDLFRKKTREKRAGSEYTMSLSEWEDCLSGGEMPEETLETTLLAEAINRFLRSLPKDARNLFIGRYYYMDPLREVAAYCGMSESKAKSLLFRTRNSLKDYLEKEGFSV
ncbi:MAG: sigma-70 family RNA polymerase sigma factor [Clostridia bacterium]|nr:sigma-70 family RNA polymerase sigma factor [Clostridia bacterium]